MKVGLRVDADTFRGTRAGVPALVSDLRQRGVRASFFFSVGPDNMGRHLWRLVRPAFLRKMLRTRAASLYGIETLLCGTFWPGRLIGRELANEIRDAEKEGHEIGLHAWDHHAWQTRIERMDAEDIRSALKKGIDALGGITGRQPACSAVPGWRCTELALIEKTRFPFVYNSDCRGSGIFAPTVDGRRLEQPQIPVTLPTYDEVIGRDGIDDETYNDYLLSLLDPRGLNVLAIHAEVEGIVRRELFRDFLARAGARGVEFLPLGALLDHLEVPSGSIERANVPGREGWIARQVSLRAR